MTTRPFRLTAPVIPEQELHETVAALCHIMVAPPAQWAFYPAGGVQLSPAQAAKLARMGLRRGWPDFLFIHLGQVFAIELKRLGGRLSRTRIVRTKRGSPRVLEGQEDTFPALEAAGMTIVVCHTADEVLATLAQWKIPLRGRIMAA
jgi:hypothetical protein